MKISHMIISLCQSGISSDGLKCWNNQQHGIYIIKSDPQHCLDNFFFHHIGVVMKGLYIQLVYIKTNISTVLLFVMKYLKH